MEIYVLVRNWVKDEELKTEVIKASVSMIELEELRDVIDEKWYQAKEKYSLDISKLSKEIGTVIAENLDSIKFSGETDLEDISITLAEDWEDIQSGKKSFNFYGLKCVDRSKFRHLLPVAKIEEDGSIAPIDSMTIHKTELDNVLEVCEAKDHSDKEH